MDFSVTEAIKVRDITALASATGFSRRTLYRWAQENKVAGDGLLRDMRLKQLMAGLRKVPAKKARRAS